MKSNDDIHSELESIKKLLILQLVHNGISPHDIAKAVGMSTKTIYKFIPKKSTKNTKK